MRQQDRLRSLFPVVRRRLCLLDTLVTPMMFLSDSEWDKRVSFVCIEALNAWVSFMRFFYLSSACGAKMVTGTRVTTARGRMTETTALLEAARFKKGNPSFAGKVAWGDEPAWYDARRIRVLFARLGISNEPAFATALGYPTNVLDGLPRFRNFYAHRNLRTLTTLKPLTLGLPQTKHPSHALKFAMVGRHRPAIRDWLSDLINISDLLCN